jgi:hypothetical protein
VVGAGSDVSLENDCDYCIAAQTIVSVVGAETPAMDETQPSAPVVGGVSLLL